MDNVEPLVTFRIDSTASGQRHETPGHMIRASLVILSNEPGMLDFRFDVVGDSRQAAGRRMDGVENLL